MEATKEITPRTQLNKGQLLKVTIKEEGRRQQSFWARVDSRYNKFNIYIRLNKDGDEINSRTTGFFPHITTHIEKELIDHRLLVREQLAGYSKVYGWLETK